MNEEGYMLVATKNPLYLKLARHAARSLKLYDPTRPVAIAVDDVLLPMARGFGDQVVRLKNKRGLMGTEHHLFLNEFSPFERTLYIDCDCLAVSNRLADVWPEIATRHVLFPGQKISEGKWRVPINRVLKRFQISHIVRNNGGVFGFDKSEQAQAFFKRAQKLFEKKHPEITIKHVSGGGFANEPFWGTALAICGIDPYPDVNDLNVSTRNHTGWALHGGNGAGRHLAIQKGDQWRHPIICHFLGIGGDKCPNDLYRALVAANEKP